MLLSMVLRFACESEIAVTGVKPWRIAPGEFRKCLVSQRRSANTASKTQGFCLTDKGCIF
jgi:hypothetical protein